MYSQLASMYLQLASMYSQLASMYLQLALMYSQLASMYLQLASMYSQLASMYSQLALNVFYIDDSVVAFNEIFFDIIQIYNTIDIRLTDIVKTMNDINRL